MHNHWPEPLQLHSGQNIGVLEVVTLAETPAATGNHLLASSTTMPTTTSRAPLAAPAATAKRAIPLRLADVFSPGADDLGSTPLLEHAIETHGPPLSQPYWRQNPAVRRELMPAGTANAVQQYHPPLEQPMGLSSVAMVRKKVDNLRFCVDFRQLNAATVKDAHPLPRIDDLLDALHGAKRVLHPGPQKWVLAGGHHRARQGQDCVSNEQWATVRVQPAPLCDKCIAPATFSRLMDRILTGLHWETYLFYLDDIIVFSSTCGRSTSLDSAKYSSDRGTPTSSWGLTSALLQPRSSTTWVTDGGRGRPTASEASLLAAILGGSHLPKCPPRSALSWV